MTNDFLTKEGFEKSCDDKSNFLIKILLQVLNILQA